MSSSSDDESFLALVNLINVNNANNKKRQYWVHSYWKKNQKIKRSVFLMYSKNYIPIQSDSNHFIE
jgi:hypothetical protein